MATSMNGWEGVIGIVLAAGRSIRMNPVDVPKGLLRVGGKYVLAHITDYWMRYCNRFLVVVSPEARPLYELALQNVAASIELVEQPKPMGIADALSFTESRIDGRFIAILGDCLCNGNFLIPPEMANGFGILSVMGGSQVIERSYTLHYGKERMNGLVEKPKAMQIAKKYCGLGYYFFSPSVFNYIRKTPPSALRSEVEITDVIDGMIKAGESVSPVLFKGRYINLTYPEDIKVAEQIMEVTV